MSIKGGLAEFQPRNDTIRNVVFLNDAGNSPANFHARPGEGRGLAVGSAGERQVVPRDRRKPRIRSSSGKLRGSGLEVQTSELDVVEAISTL